MQSTAERYNLSQGCEGSKSEWILVQWSKKELQGVILEDVELKLELFESQGRDMRTGKFGCLLSKERNDTIMTVIHDLLLKTYHGHALEARNTAEQNLPFSVIYIAT